MTSAKQPGAAARRFGLTSDELADAVIIRGKARPLDERSIGAKSDEPLPWLYERTFELTDVIVLGGDATLLDQERSLTFKGYTMLPPAKRSDDTRNPEVHLDGQAFFDRKLPQEPNEVGLVIGGAEIEPMTGFMGKTASIESGMLRGSSVRAFLSKGADATLLEALPLLAGFKGPVTLASATAATQASHPLVALDALRQASAGGEADQVGVLALWLLHPSQPTRVKLVAVELLGEAIRELGRSTTMADVLGRVAATAWEAERAHPLYPAYLQTLQLAADHSGTPELQLHLEGLATDSLFGELSALADELAEKTHKQRPPRDDQQSE